MTAVGKPATIIEARDVVKSFGQTPALRGATIDSVQLVALAPLLARHLGITVAD